MFCKLHIRLRPNNVVAREHYDGSLRGYIEMELPPEPYTEDEVRLLATLTIIGWQRQWVSEDCTYTFDFSMGPAYSGARETKYPIDHWPLNRLNIWEG